MNIVHLLIVGVVFNVYKLHNCYIADLILQYVYIIALIWRRPIFKKGTSELWYARTPCSTLTMAYHTQTAKNFLLT